MSLSEKKFSFNSTNVRFFNRVQHHFFAAGMSTLWRISRPAAKALVQRMFFSPPAFRMSDQQKKISNIAQQFLFESCGRQLTGYQWGRGPAVVLLHGWGGSALQLDCFIFPLTKAGFSVFSFDQPSHGYSEGRQTNYFEFSNAARDFLSLLSKKDVTAVIGHSLGACAAVNVLSHTRADITPVLISPAFFLFEMLDETFDRYKVPEKIYTDIIDNIGKQTGHNRKTENPIDLVQEIHQSVSVFHDISDTVVPYSHVQNAQSVRENIRLFPTTGLNHLRILRDRKVINTIVSQISRRHVLKKMALAPEDQAQDHKDDADLKVRSA